MGHFYECDSCQQVTETKTNTPKPPNWVSITCSKRQNTAHGQEAHNVANIMLCDKCAPTTDVKQMKDSLKTTLIEYFKNK